MDLNGSTLPFEWVPLHIAIPGNEGGTCTGKAGACFPPLQCNLTLQTAKAGADEAGGGTGGVFGCPKGLLVFSRFGGGHIIDSDLILFRRGQAVGGVNRCERLVRVEGH